MFQKENPGWSSYSNNPIQSIININGNIICIPEVEIISNFNEGIVVRFKSGKEVFIKDTTTDKVWEILNG